MSTEAPLPPATVAVAVVSWNTRELLAAALDALKEDADAGRVDVWVVDNGSTDGSRALVAERYPWVTLVTPDRNLGFGPAVNLVAERTQSRLIAAANADVRLEPGALEQLIAAIDRAPEVGMVGPRLLLLDGSTQVSVRPFPSIGSALLLATHASRFSERARRALRLEGHWEPDPGESVPWLTGAFVVIDRSAFDQAGGFDPTQWLYAEDMDLCWRMARRGWQIRWVPEARAHHAHSAATSQHFGDAALITHVIATTYLWMLRRRGGVVTRIAAGIAVIDLLVRLAWAAVSERDRLDLARREALIAELRGHLAGLASRRTLHERVQMRQRRRG